MINSTVRTFSANLPIQLRPVKVFHGLRTKNVLVFIADRDGYPYWYTGEIKYERDCVILQQGFIGYLYRITIFSGERYI